MSIAKIRLNDGTYTAIGVATSSTPPDVQVFQAASGTWTKPPGARYVLVECQGAGGGGGGAATTLAGEAANASGGGGGAWSKKLYDATALGATVTVTVGQSGSAGVGSGTNGGNGGPTTFDVVTAGGGNGGGSSIAANNAVVTGSASGGSASGGDINIRGGSSPRGFRLASGAFAMSGAGGASVWGSSAPAIATGDGLAGIQWGGGGAGGCNFGAQGTARNGGAGAQGVCIVTTYF
jgi:hypothetical protein